jgi:hypothetical protein
MLPPFRKKREEPALSEAEGAHGSVIVPQYRGRATLQRRVKRPFIEIVIPTEAGANATASGGTCFCLGSAKRLESCHPERSEGPM